MRQKQGTATVDGIATNTAAQRALDALASVNKAELSEDDQSAYAEAAIRVGTVRWGAQTGMRPVGRLTLRAAAGENGQTCLSVATTPAAASAQPLRCTYGVVWPQSLSVNPAGNIATLPYSRSTAGAKCGYCGATKLDGRSMFCRHPANARTWVTLNLQAGCPAAHRCWWHGRFARMVACVAALKLSVSIRC